MELQARLKDLQTKGLAVVAISYDTPEVLAAFAQQRQITFPLLSDADSTAITAFGLLNPAVAWGLGADKDDPAIVRQVETFVSFNGRASEMMRGMAVPGTLIVDRRGRVVSRFFEESYTDRSTTESLMLKAGAGSPAVRATRISSGQLDLTAYPVMRPSSSATAFRSCSTSRHTRACMCTRLVRPATAPSR